MSKTIIIKLTKAGNRTGPFKLYDNLGTLLGDNITKQNLIDGYSVSVNEEVTSFILDSIGKCKTQIQILIENLTVEEIASISFSKKNTATLWRHLTDTTKYNTYYGNIEPYIIEYPFSYQSYDEILQNVKDYTKSYKYLPIPDGVYNITARVEVNEWFNKALLYNGQQSTGILNLVPKPMNSLKDYMKYPMYSADSKTIIYTKSDNFYQYNTFWSLVKDVTKPLFNVSCESLSIDKVINQSNMDYSKRSFKKSPLRAKELKIRHILDSRSDLHLISQFLIAPAMISYK